MTSEILDAQLDRHHNLSRIVDELNVFFRDPWSIDFGEAFYRLGDQIVFAPE